MASFSPWEAHEDHKEAVRLREISLPPQYRMAGNARLLRDALLAVMLLNVNMTPLGKTLEETMNRVRKRGNKQAEMRTKATLLKKRMTSAQIDKATLAAQELYHWEVVKARRAISG